MLNVLID